MLIQTISASIGRIPTKAERFSSAKRLFAVLPVKTKLRFKRVKVIDPCRSGYNSAKRMITNRQNTISRTKEMYGEELKRVIAVLLFCYLITKSRETGSKPGASMISLPFPFLPTVLRYVPAIPPSAVTTLGPTSSRSPSVWNDRGS